MKYTISILVLFVVLTAGVVFGAEEVPQYSKLGKYETPVPYAGIRNWYVTQNLGATGARGWIYGHKGNTSKSREILIKSVEAGSPADGVLQAYDIILGAAAGSASAKEFMTDARLDLAKAITAAESKLAGGNLRLLVWRDGETRQVLVKLKVMDDYSDTAPFDCDKSFQVVADAADYLAGRMHADGFKDMTGATNAMLLFACENDKYLDHVRRSAMRMGPNHTINDAGHESWRWGYCNLFLCEYYLATGDKRVLPTIEGYCKVIADGQCNPGTWGHKAVPDRKPPGYGSLNQAGLICFMSLVLGYECGVEFDGDVIKRSIEFYGGYAGKGGIPYGDHPPYNNATSNGKNGSAAVVFNMLGAEPSAQWFARLCCSANLGAFEGGHTGNYFNQTWSPLGASLAGRENYQKFMGRFNSYRDLARRWDGSFITQPVPEKREGDLGSINYVNKGPLWSTGGFALSYLADNKTLGVLGRKCSVFGKNCPKVLKPALELYYQKRFTDCRKAADEFCESSDELTKQMAVQLKTMAGRNIRSTLFTLADMHRNLAKGDVYLLGRQLEGIESIIDPKDKRLKKFYEAMKDSANAGAIKSGKEYYEYTFGHNSRCMKGFSQFLYSGMHYKLVGLAQRGSEPYKRMAREWMESHPYIQDRVDMTLVGAAKVGKNSFEVADPKKVKTLVLDWKAHGTLKVSLNGTKIVELTNENGNKRQGSLAIMLKPSTVELLKAGSNELTVEYDAIDKKSTYECKLQAFSKS